MLRLWKTQCTSCGRHSHRKPCAMTIQMLDKVTTIILSTRAAVAGSSRRTTLHATLMLISLTTLMTINANATTTTSIDHLKLYAHSKIINYKQFQCFNQLITAESHWNINAINGSQYGLGQMRNPKYRNLDGYRMIDWSIRYNIHRYKSHCNALRFFKKNGYS